MRQLSYILSVYLCWNSIVFANGNLSDVISQAMQSTISIYPADDNAEAGGGSGVIVSPDGYAVTNFHVVQPCGTAMKCAMTDGKLYDAVIVGIDPVGDLAVIKLLPTATPFAFAELADSNNVQVGDTAIVIGNPFLLATDYKPCVSQGIISGIHRYQPPSGTFLEYTDCLQTDAAVNPGNSGGPLFNDRGKVIGIVGRCSFEKRGRVNVGIGFAISSNQVRYFLGDLKSGRIVDHGTMNAAVVTDRDGNVVFEDVLGTSDAYRNGLRYNDELLQFAGRAVGSANMFKNTLGIFPKGWRLPVTVRGSDGKRFETLVRLAGLHSESELLQKFQTVLEDEQPQKKQQPRRRTSGTNTVANYEAKTGYANFYFNRLEQERVLKTWRNSQSATNSAQLVISGFPFTVTDTGVQYDLPFGKGVWNANLMLETTDFVIDPLSHYQSPKGSGGLFTALYLMRRLSQSGNIADAEIVYTGTAPLGGNLAVLYDVITVTWRGNDVRFYFAPAGTLSLIEMFGSSLEHPCEVYFHQDGIEVCCGKNVYLGKGGRREAGGGSESIVPPAVGHLIPASNKIVKIYGASAGGLHGYQSGVLVSEDGLVLTALTAALQTNDLRMVLYDGRQYEAEFVRGDPMKETALLRLKCSADERFSYFAINTRGQLFALGTPIFALSNPFNIAEGNEAVSVQRGLIAARTQLSARRGVFETPYKGAVYVVDCTVNNPGACGGAVITADGGELVGIIGKELRNKENNAWLNYVVPIDGSDIETKSVNTSGARTTAPTTVEHIPEDTIKIFQRWGVMLIPPVGERTPPFVDAVLPNSPAAQAGLQTDDVIVMINGVLTPSLASVEEQIYSLDKTKPVTLTVERDYTLVEVTLASGE